ncbi:hypothetical protein L3X38_032383 [Prunus dulcis]|uniref:Agenet domain-containing protein n=1 Tax=Prunus dulcis TaxID=3755 RepID=A0AAD4VG43_PRUDU|nr:hypothetical protein L3X38_032383 [Prunus dulcis]
MVDAFYDMGWWVGQITQNLTEEKYLVRLKFTKEVKECSPSDLRPHMEWTDSGWVTETNGTWADCFQRMAEAIFSPGTADSELKGGAERELQLDDGDAGDAGGDIDTRGAGDAGRDGHDGDAGDVGGAGGDIDTGRAGDAGGSTSPASPSSPSSPVSPASPARPVSISPPAPPASPASPSCPSRPASPASPASPSSNWGAERELQLDDGDAGDAGGDIDTRGAGDAGRDGHDGDAGGAGGDIDTGRAGDAGDTGDDGDAGDVDPDKKVDVFRVVEAELQYFVNEIDLIHLNSGQELKDGIEALLLQESARLHETSNTPLISKFTFMYSAINGDEWIELPIDEMDWVDFVQHVRHIYAFDVLLEIDDVDVQVFKVDDFDGGIGHFLGPVRVFDHNDIPSLEETVAKLHERQLCLAGCCRLCLVLF